MNFYHLIPLVLVLFSLVLILIVLKGNYGKTVNILFSLYLFGLATWGALIYFMRSSPTLEIAYSWEQWIMALLPILPVSFYHFSVLYTRTILPRFLLPLAYVICAFFIVISRTDLVVTGMQLKPYGYAPIFGPMFPLLGLFSYAFIIMALFIFLKASRITPYAEERNRNNYIIAGMVISIVGGTFDLLPILGLPLYPGAIIGDIAFCIITTFAIVKHHLLDINVVIRKGTAYLFMSTMVAIPYVGLLFLIYVGFEGKVLIWINFLLIVLLALAMQPLWSRMQRLVDRWFYRDRYNQLKALSEFSQNIHLIAKAAQFRPKLVNLLAEAMHASTVYLVEKVQSTEEFEVTSYVDKNGLPRRTVFRSDSLLVKWLGSSGRLFDCRDIELLPQLQAITKGEREQLAQMGAQLVIPMQRSDGRLLGFLILGEKLSEEPYSLEEIQFLGTLSKQFATKLENLMLYWETMKARDSLETWLNSMTDCIAICNSESKVTFMNKAAVEKFGNRNGKLVSMLPGETVESPDDQFIEGIDIPSEGIAYSAMIDDSYYDIAVGPFAEPDGSTSTIFVLRDVTGRHKMEAEKKELEQKAQLASRLAAVGEMASGIAHEINNPLTGVIGYTQFLMQRELPPDIKQDVKAAYDGAQRVAGIVERLLAFSRQHKPHRQLVSINDILQSTLKLREYHLRTNNIEVTTQLDHSLPVIVADGGQLQQVFLNLIINAEKEMKLAHNEGKLLIKTESDSDVVRVSFVDDGHGISNENMGRIFEPFFTTREVGDGTGLGLSVCYGLVAEHGGKIYAENNPGGGATFIVEIPIITQIDQAAEPVKVEEDTTKVVKSKILIVDDEPEIRTMLERVLTGEGHIVHCAHNAQAALEKIKSERYRLILLDIKMPGMSGIELYRELEKMAKSLAQRVVFITGDVLEPTTREFFSTTEATYITKPLDSNQLKKKVNAMLSES